MEFTDETFGQSVLRHASCKGYKYPGGVFEKTTKDYSALIIFLKRGLKIKKSKFWKFF